MPDIALFQPDIPQNTGTILRLAACLGLTTHVIGPAGFDLSDRALKRAALDYLSAADLVRHADWPSFLRAPACQAGRLVLMTTRAERSYTSFDFAREDILLFGRESSGAPDYVHEAASVRLRIPIRPQTRSLNLAASVAMVCGEALRQTSTFPDLEAQTT